VADRARQVTLLRNEVEPPGGRAFLAGQVANDLSLDLRVRVCVLAGGSQQLFEVGGRAVGVRWGDQPGTQAPEQLSNRGVLRLLRVGAGGVGHLTE